MIKKMTSKAKQMGFTFVELSVVIAIGTLLSVFAAKEFVDNFQEDLAESTGGYHISLKSVLENYTTTYVTEISNSLPVDNAQRNRVDAAGNPLPDIAATVTISAADSIQPTFAQLKQLNVMPSGFPERNPFGQTMSVRITRGALCPGPGCQITGYAYTNTPVVVSGGRDTVLANLARAKSGGYGIISTQIAPATLASRNCEPIPNPIGGTPVNVIGVCSQLNAGLFAQFVRRGDNRLTELNNGLNVNGAINSTGVITGAELVSQGNVTATGAVTADSVTARGNITSTNGDLIANTGAILATGNNATSRVGAGTGVGGCSLAELLSSGGAGRVVVNAANCVTRAFIDGSTGTMGVANAGGLATVTLRGNESQVEAGSGTNRVLIDGSTGGVIANNRVTVTDGNIIARATMETNGVIAARDTAGAVTAQLDGSGSGSVRVAGNRVVLDGANGSATAESLRASGTATVNTVCPAGTPTGEVRQNSASPGALVVCQGGSWVPVGPRVVTANSACPLGGEIGIDSTGGAMFCKVSGGGPGGFFLPLRNVISDFVFVASTYVRDGNILPKPSCAQFGTAAGLPLIFIVGQTEGSPDASFNRFATDNGTSWTINLKRGDVTTRLVGDLALAQQYCYYAS